MSKMLFPLLILSILFGSDARLEIIKGQKKLPLVIVNLSSLEWERKIALLLSKDLEISGNFAVETREKERESNPDYIFYQAKKADLFVFISKEKDGNFVLELFDVNSKQKVLQTKIRPSSFKHYPFVAHKMANQINQKLKAPSIGWMEEKVIFSELTGASKSRIVIADYTLTYRENVIEGGLNIFPKWADKKKESFFFTKYLDRPTIVKYDLKTKKIEKLISSQGMAIVSDVDTDYKRILLTMAPIAQADVYLYHLESKELNRLTNYPGIDVGANFVEDKKKIIFISDRLGYPNVFSMDEKGGKVEQIVFHGRNNSSATSNGKSIVYSSREEKNEFGTSTFNLYIIGLDGTSIRRLTLNGANQMPRFSLDKENVMFLKNTDSQSAIGIIRLRYNKTHLFPIRGMRIQSFDW